MNNQSSHGFSTILLIFSSALLIGVFVLGLFLTMQRAEVKASVNTTQQD